MYFNRLVLTKLLKFEIHVGLPHWDGFFLLVSDLQLDFDSYV